MSNKNKKIILVIVILILSIGVVGISFAAYTYSRSGTTNSKQLVGDIYMHYSENNTLSISNAMPSNTYDQTKYFEFTIDGKNTTTNKDIYYDIILTHGDVPNGKTEENRILDRFLRFRLTEVINNEETEIFTNRNYIDLTNKRIYVETIPKNTNSEVTHTYRLYMWIGNNVIIGNTEKANYTESEWSNLFASIKVNSSGDFDEKEVDNSTDASCFTATKTIANATLNSPLSSDALSACIQFTTNWTWQTGETVEAFCNGTGTLRGSTFQEKLDNGDFISSSLDYFYENDIISGEEAVMIKYYDSSCGSEVVIPSSLPLITGYTLNSPLSSDALSACIQYTTDWPWHAGETAEAFCNGTGTWGGGTFQELLDDNYFSSSNLDYFYLNDIISATVSINTYPVKEIGDTAFQNKNLTSVVIPNGVTEISVLAFANNQITTITIPNSVTTIDTDAFRNNQITSVTIPSSVTKLYCDAFDDTVTITKENPNLVCEDGR